MFCATHTPEANERLWVRRLEEFAAFKRRFGHGIVPSQWAAALDLGYWVTGQRILGKRGVLSPERRAALEAAGFVWDVVAEKRRLAVVDPGLLAEVKALVRREGGLWRRGGVGGGVGVGVGG